MKMEIDTENLDVLARVENILREAGFQQANSGIIWVFEPWEIVLYMGAAAAIGAFAQRGYCLGKNKSCGGRGK